MRVVCVALVLGISGCSLIYGDALPVGASASPPLDASSPDTSEPETIAPDTGAPDALEVETSATANRPLSCGLATCKPGEHCCWRADGDVCQATACATDDKFMATVRCTSAYHCDVGQRCCIGKRWPTLVPKETGCGPPECSDGIWCETDDLRGCPGARVCTENGPHFGEAGTHQRKIHYCGL